MIQVFAFGHSIIYGNWDTEGGWVQRLRSYLDERALDQQEEELVSEVFNLGIPGETSSELLDRFERELERRVWEEVEQVVLIQTGANDALEMVEQEEIKVSKDEYRRNLEELVDQAREHAGHVFVISDIYTAIDGEIPWAEDTAINDERLGEYVEIQREVCSGREVELIDLRGLKDSEEWVQMMEEGMHPDNDGHRLIFEEVKQRLESKDLI